MGPVVLLGVWMCVMVQEGGAGPDCIKVNSCKCIMKDGTGVISLDRVGGHGSFLRPVPRQPGVQDQNQDQDQDGDLLLAFSPCVPLAQLEGTECSNTAACLLARHTGSIIRYENYGRHDGSVFQYNDSTRTLSVSYFTTAHVARPMTIIHYRCAANRSALLVLRGGQGGPGGPGGAGGPLQVWVGGPCACPNACGAGDLGLGTIFLIILIISAAAYFILGSCALRAFRTSSGVQIAPQESVWCIACYLLRERPAGRGRQRHSSGRHDTL